MRDEKRQTPICPWCGEEIRKGAIICRFCKNDVTPRGIEAARDFVEGKTPDAGGRGAGAGPATGGAPPGAAPSGREPAYGQIATAMPPTLLDRILAVGETIDEGERRPIAVLFSDLCAFTTLTGELGPERMNDLLDRVYAETQAIVAYYGGIVEKFIGDAVMAIFGAVQAYGDDPERAIRAALDVREAVRRIGREEDVPLDSHAGVAFGQVAFTVRGERGKIDYRSIGDAVNLASRLQHEAGDGQTLVDERTYRQTRTVFDWEKTGPFAVKGMDKPVVAYRVEKVRTRFSHARLGERIAMAPMVGRRTEIELLNVTARRVQKGQVRIVLVEGEAGVGKSRLIYEFQSALPHDKWHCFTGRCLSYGENTPFFPFLELLRSILFSHGEEEEERRIDADLLSRRIDDLYKPALRRNRPGARRKETVRLKERTLWALRLLFSVDPGENPLLALSPRDRREAIFSSVADLLARLGERRPTMIVLEDFQWSDNDSRDLLSFLLERMGAQPLLFIVVSRPYPAPPVALPPKDLIRISLKELSDKNSETLLQRLMGVERIPASLRDLICRRTDGNPFYMEEIVLDLEERGILQRRGNAYKLARPVETVEIPDTVEGVVLARLDRLERKVRSVLQCASVIGQEFQQQVLRQVAEVGQRLRDHLARLVEEDYVLRQTLIPEMVYVFRHVVLRDVAYGTLLERRRREYHARVAEAIEVLFPNNLDEFVELLAHHAERGGATDKALGYLERAALKCESLFSNRSAADFWERLLKCLERAEREKKPPRGAAEVARLRVHACLHLGELCRKTGQAERGIAAYELARSQARALDEPPLEAQALRGLAEAHRYSGDMTRAIETLREACASAEKSGEGDLIASCNILRSHFERVRGNFSEAGECARRVLDHARESGNRVLYYQALTHLGIARMYDGRLDEAEARYAEAQEIAEELGRKAEWVQIEMNRGIVSMKRGDCANARKRYANAASRAQKIEFELGYQLALLALGDLCLKTGGYGRAAAVSVRSIRRSEKARFSDILSVALSNLARAQIALGDLASARKGLDESEKIARADDDYVGLIAALSVRVEWLLARGEKRRAFDQAQEVLKEVELHCEIEHLSSASLLVARSLLALGRADEALKAAREAEEAATRSGVVGDRAWALWCIGLCHLKRKESDAAAERFTESLELARRAGDKELQQTIRESAS